jgi:eukaryotic-like serine/threonine-protein kinase
VTTRFAPGAVIDGFLLEERLHQGSMSGVWRVRRESEPAGEAMAMKIPLVSDFDDPAAIVGFEVEQMILPTLSGPHVPRFIASGDFSKQPYIVMELLKGESLRKRLGETPLPADEVARIGARVATALHALHAQHVIHLDLKPSNVMFRDSGEAVLLDFGLSRHDALPDLLQEEFRLPMGTGPYISPEQVRHNRSDPQPALAPGGHTGVPRGGSGRPPRDGGASRFSAPAPGADRADRAGRASRPGRRARRGPPALPLAR